MRHLLYTLKQISDGNFYSSLEFQVMILTSLKAKLVVPVIVETLL